MGQMVIKYDTLSLSQQVLERQEGHAQQIATYLPANADIGDSTGLLLSVFDPLSKLAVRVGSDAATVLGELEQAMAGAVGDTQLDVADSDGKVGDAFSKLIGRLGIHGADSNYPDLGGPTLPAAGEGAPGRLRRRRVVLLGEGAGHGRGAVRQRQRRQRADRPGRPVGLDRRTSPS